MAFHIDAENTATEPVMNLEHTPLSRRPLAAPARSLWTLAPGRAMTLRARQTGELTLVRGAAWVTRRGPHPATGKGALGDVVLQAGTRLSLGAGESLVLEPIAVAGVPAQLLAFDWCATGAADAAWDTAVARPAGELRRALGDAALAAARLLSGVAAWGAHQLWRARPPLRRARRATAGEKP